MKIVATIEADAEKIKALLEHLFTHHPDATIHVNPPADSTIKVGGPAPASATPTGHHKP